MFLAHEGFPPVHGSTRLVDKIAISEAPPAIPMSELFDQAAAKQRAPMRFVWQMDAEERFTVASEEFATLLGRATAAALGRPWSELAALLALDPEDQVAVAVASRETWSGLRIAWPVDEGTERLTVELSGLPVYDRERVFRSYRGFGICRDGARLAVLQSRRRSNAVAAASGPENVVRLRPEREGATPVLSVGERNAFQELTRELQERLASAAASSPAPSAAELSATRAGEQAAALARAQNEILALKSLLEQTSAELALARREGAFASQGAAAGDFRLDFLARLSHEIRNPLNAIIGFSEVMAQEQLGLLGNERYRQYAGDIHDSGTLLLALVNDLIDLTQIEGGRIDLDPAGVALNPLTQQCVALLQPQANRAHVILRSALSPAFPRLRADARALRQIVLDLMAHSVTLAGAGGQVIVTTTRNDRGEVMLRLRDSGVTMSESEIALALAPFRPAATLRRGEGARVLGLPLAKALAEANGAAFAIKGAAGGGTLIEVSFPTERVLAVNVR